MKYFLSSLWLITIFFSSPYIKAQNNDERISRTLEKVNQYKINNQNDSALYELIALNQNLKANGHESGYIYVDAGNIYFQLKLDNMAYRLYNKALAIFKTTNDRIGESIVLENFGNLHNRTHPGGDSALYYFNKALKLQKEADDPYYSAYSQRALAQLYSYKRNFDKAYPLIHQAIKAIQNPDIRNHPRYKWDVQFIPQQVYLTASDIFRTENKHLDSAEYFLKQAIRMSKVYGIDAHRVRYLTFLSTYYMEQKQWPQAFDAIKQATALTDSIGYVWGKVGTLQALRNYYHQTKDTIMEAKAGYDYLLYKDQMYNKRNNDDLIIMSNVILQYENEMEIERQQNLLMEKERINRYQRQQTYLLLGILLILIVGLAMVIKLYRSLHQKNKQVEQYSKELETSNETLRTLLSVISHDVRSPFNTLLGLSKVTLMETDLGTSDYRTRVNMMHDASAKGLILLDNLLQWVALQRDKTLIKKEKVDVPVLIRETLHELSSVALTQNVSIEKNIESQECFTDRNSMKAIVRNLLTNAIKYSSGKRVLIDITDKDGQLIIRVTDQGPGIPEDILNGLFEKGDMKKVAAKGGGLGMQIVKQLVTDLGGTITARNLEVGAMFEVSIPSN